MEESLFLSLFVLYTLGCGEVCHPEAPLSFLPISSSLLCDRHSFLNATEGGSDVDHTHRSQLKMVP